jgi:hypothetical protein
VRGEGGRPAMGGGAMRRRWAGPSERHREQRYRAVEMTEVVGGGRRAVEAKYHPEWKA